MMTKIRILVAGVVLFGISAAMAGESGVPNRIATAQVGEWATYKMPTGYTQKLTVTNREGEGPTAMVTVLVENFYEGELVDSSEIVQEAGERVNPVEVPDDPKISIKVEMKDVTVKGRTIRATVVKVEREADVDDEDDEEIEWYLSNEIPVFGLIKQDTDDDMEYELLDYGTK